MIASHNGSTIALKPFDPICGGGTEPWHALKTRRNLKLITQISSMHIFCTRIYPTKPTWAGLLQLLLLFLAHPFPKFAYYFTCFTQALLLALVVQVYWSPVIVLEHNY